MGAGVSAGGVAAPTKHAVGPPALTENTLRVVKIRLLYEIQIFFNELPGEGRQLAEL